MHRSSHRQLLAFVWQWPTRLRFLQPAPAGGHLGHVCKTVLEPCVLGNGSTETARQFAKWPPVFSIMEVHFVDVKSGFEPGHGCTCAPEHPWGEAHVPDQNFCNTCHCTGTTLVPIAVPVQVFLVLIVPAWPGSDWRTVLAGRCYLIATGVVYQ